MEPWLPLTDICLYGGGESYSNSCWLMTLPWNVHLQVFGGNFKSTQNKAREMA